MTQIDQIIAGLGKLLCRIGIHDWNWCGFKRRECARCLKELNDGQN